MGDAPIHTPGIAPGIFFITPKLIGCNIFVAHDEGLHKDWIIRVSVKANNPRGVSHKTTEFSLVSVVTKYCVVSFWFNWCTFQTESAGEQKSTEEMEKEKKKEEKKKKMSELAKPKNKQTEEDENSWWKPPPSGLHDIWPHEMCYENH